MGTKTLTDIHNDLKLLITAISGFEEGEEGFQICERFALSQIKHHRYLSVNSNAVKREIDEITQKFLIHGKYDVAKEFQKLVESFLTGFDFERHPQYDVQWSLLSLLLNLANETNKSEVSSSTQSGRDRNQTLNVTAEEDKSEEIDWAQYLKEGQEDFFCNYESDSDSDWSNDENDGQLDLSTDKNQEAAATKNAAATLSNEAIKLYSERIQRRLPQELVSKNWLRVNVQNTWWNELDWNQYKIDSEFEAANLYEFWRKNTLRSNKIIGTLSEYQACRELLWMFHTLSQMTVFQEESETEFSIRDVTIPSLTTVAFKSMLLSYCQHFKMIREIEAFLDKLFNQSNSSVQNCKPPLTYEAYGIAIQQELLHIKKKLVELELEIMKQDGQNTFLSLSKTLKKYLDRVKIIFEIHNAVAVDWEKSTNWQCASKLLSNLYLKTQNSSNHETINLCASLYLASLSVYLNIVNVWLSEGRLEDWREEFIIYKCSDSVENLSRDEGGPLDGFASRELDPLCLKDPLMQVLLHKVYQIGRSVELLVALDRISDLWNLMDQEKVERRSLNIECLEKIMSECAKYNSSFVDATDSASLQIIEIPVPRSCDSDVEQNIIQQVSASNNPFLTKALEGFIFPESNHDIVDAGSTCLSEQEKERTGNQSLELLMNSDLVLPWRKIFECSVAKVLQAKFSGASKLVKDILMSEYKLGEQLKLMRSVYMMETSHVMNQFCKLIFTEIEANNMWNNSYFVMCLLEDVLSHEWPDSSSRWSITVSNTRTTKVLEAVSGIKLHYAAGWPINMLLNEEAIDKYNKIFRFELKLKWALWTLNTLRFNDLEKMNESTIPDAVQHFHIRRLESLRFWMLHAVGSIHAYLSGQVLQGLGNTFENSLAQANNLEEIVTIHSEYLDNVHEHCLQTEKFEDLIGTIHKLLEMCVEIRERWKPESLVYIGKALDQLENDYVKYHTYLALGLHNAVQHKDADYRKSAISHKLLQYVGQIKPRLLEADTLTNDERLRALGAKDSLHKLLYPVVPTLKCQNHSMQDYMTDLGRNILNEIAHQSLPPSGTPVKIPKRVFRCTCRGTDVHSTASNYEQAFAYLRWYRLREQRKSLDSSLTSCDACDSLDDILGDSMLQRYDDSDDDF